MTVSYYCKSCKKNNKIKTKSSNRFELQQELGDEINKRCDHCGNLEKRHINRLTADPNYTFFFITFFAAIIFTILFWNMSFIAFATLAPTWAYFETLKRANLFNKTKIQRRDK